MSDINNSKSNSDVSSEESWSVIDSLNTEPNKTSLESIVVIDKDTNEEDVVEPHSDKSFVDLTEETHHEAKKLPKKSGSKKLKSKKKKCKELPFNISLLIMMACVITVSGISILSTIFANEKHAIHKLETDFSEQLRQSEPEIDVIFKKTSEIVANYSEMLSNVEGDDICPLENPFLTNATLDEAFGPVFKELVQWNVTEANPSNSPYDKLQNVVSNIYRAIKDPYIHLLLGTLLQNVCLTKVLLGMWSENTKTDTGSKKTVKNNVGLDKNKIDTKSTLSLRTKRKLLEKRIKLFEKQIALKKPSLGSRNVNNISPSPPKVDLDHQALNITGVKIDMQQPNENQQGGKVESKNLDIGIERIENSHPRKAKQRQQDVSSKLLQKDVNGNLVHTENSKIRDKYMLILEIERQKYLTQLRKEREQNQKAMAELILQKNLMQASKDAAVGNFGVTISSYYDFKEKLKSHQNNGWNSASNSTSDTANTQYVKASNKVSKIALERSLSGTENIQKPKMNLDERIVKRTDLIHESLPSISDVKATRKQAVETLTNGSLNVLLHNTSETEGKTHANKEAVHINKSVSNIMKTDAHQDKMFYGRNPALDTESYPTTEISPIKNLSEQTESELSEAFSEDDDPANQFKVVIRRKHRKRDVYQAAFDKNAGRAMLDDIIRWNDKPKAIRKYKELPFHKQDPRRSYKAVVIHKGLL